MTRQNNKAVLKSPREIAGALIRAFASQAPSNRIPQNKRPQTALAIIVQAIKHRDDSFFRVLADTIKDIKRQEENFHLSLRYAVVFGCMYCYPEDCSPGCEPPTKAEVVAMTKRLWALIRLTGDRDIDPTITHGQELEAKVAEKSSGCPHRNGAGICRGILSCGKPSADASHLGANYGQLNCGQCLQLIWPN